MRFFVPAILIIGISTSVGFAAHGLAALVAGFQAPHEAATRTAPSAAFARETSADPIVLRNPFESRPPPIEPPPEISHFLDDFTRAAPACDGVSAHAIVEAGDQSWSFASLSSANEQGLVRRGGYFSGRKVLWVNREAVWLEGADGHACHADIGAFAVPSPAKVAPRRPSRAVDPEVAKGIRATGANSYDIDRATFDRILQSTAELMGDVRIAPEKVGDRVAGMKLGRLREGSVLTLVGLKEGDRLDAINGIELTSPEAGLEAFAKLQNAPKIVLKITRGANATELQYEVK